MLKKMEIFALDYPDEKRSIDHSEIDYSVGKLSILIAS
jgi:hypothetical protein